MKLAEYLSPSCVQVGAHAENKDGVLHALARLAKAHPQLADCPEEEIYRGFQERERLGSTGFSQQIAIPHFVSERIDQFVVGVMTLDHGVDFDSLDGQPTRLVVFIIAPAAKRNQHLGVLANIARFLREPDHVKTLLESPSAEALHAYVLSQRPEQGEVVLHVKRHLFTVIIQNEESFEEALNILTEIEGGHLSILEANNASKYLYNMPLFASFWSGDSQGFNRVILAVVPRNQTNVALQKLNTLVEKLPGQQGVMVMVQDLFFSIGALAV